MKGENFTALGTIFLFIILINSKSVKTNSTLVLEDRIIPPATHEELLKLLLSDGHIQTCLCAADEAYILGEDGNSTCAPYQTYIPIILSAETIEPFEVNVTSFGHIDLAQPKCDNDSTLVSIHARDFFFLPSGSVFHVLTHREFFSTDYCLEHSTNHLGNISYVIKMCLKNTDVNVCCSEETRAELGSSCDAPNPTVWFGFSFLIDPIIESTESTPLKCKEGEIVTHVPLESPSTSAYLDHIEQTTYLVIFTDPQPRYLTSSEYCLYPVATAYDVSYDATFCIPDPLKKCENSTCVMKCCPEGMLYSNPINSCIPSNETSIWKPVFKAKNYSELSEQPKDYKFVYSFPICPKSFLLDSRKPADDFAVLDTGEMKMEKYDYLASPPRYCIDNFIMRDSGEIVEQALTCFPDAPPVKTLCQKAKPIIVSVLLSISCIFLAITLIVYASIKDLHAKLHGKSLLSHVTALLIAYFFLTITTSASTSLYMSVCRAFAFIIQASFLGAFFWLNIMCFDIWWTLRAMRPVAETSDSSRRRFAYYSLYAWGVPAIISAVSLVMEFLPDTVETYDLIFPGFGVKNCWFRDRAGMWIYFYSFVALLSAVNLCFFIAVAIILIQAQRANSTILKNTNQHHQERVWIYLKLFVVMGITWICEVVSSIYDADCSYWLLADIVNCLQGFFIFLIFICKRNVYTKIQNRGKTPARQIKRLVQGSSSYGSQVSQQTSLDSTTTSFRKLSTTLAYHLSRLQRESTIPEV